MPWGGGIVLGGGGIVLRFARFVGLGGGEVISTTRLVELWRRHNGCPGQAKVDRLPDADLDDGTRVERTAYGPCRARSDVVLVAVIGGGHAWPGRQAQAWILEWLTGRTSRDIDAGPVILAFLRAHSLP